MMISSYSKYLCFNSSIRTPHSTTLHSSRRVTDFGIHLNWKTLALVTLIHENLLSTLGLQIQGDINDLSRGCVDELTVQLVTILLVNIFVGQTREVLLPYPTQLYELKYMYYCISFLNEEEHWLHGENVLLQPERKELKSRVNFHHTKDKLSVQTFQAHSMNTVKWVGQLSCYFILTICSHSVRIHNAVCCSISIGTSSSSYQQHDWNQDWCIQTVASI